MAEYQPTIGLEIHVELRTKSKMFCSCLNDPDERNPNVNICPICLGHPGTLPVINQEAVNKVIKTGLALNCQIPEHSRFDRKNYFYPDLPKGYQISQLYQPLCKNGFLKVTGREIRIREIHLEEDTGSLVHPPGADYSLVNFNRAGVPLMELATEPDISSAKEARKFAEEFHLLMHYLNVSDADMEKGQMRVEVNISLSKKRGELGTKVEIKNLNSFRAVERAIDYEIKRQTEILDKGKKVIQETRGWQDVDSVTVSQREKEFAQDYRYFPEPNLPPLHITQDMVSGIKAEILELPRKRRERLVKEYGLDEKSAEIFVYNKDLGEYFEKVISELPSNLSKENLSKLIKLATNYLITDLQGLLKGRSVAGKDFRITPEKFAEFVSLIYEGQISSKIAKIVLDEMFKTGADPSQIIEEKDLTQVTDELEIEKVIKEVISKNPKAIEDFKTGKANAFQYLIGQVMAATKGKANPETASKLLTKLLKSV
jgi:aspartyl-tRNA(Asn)/glutamyl-tRNA(Gln) amidotransferase subunit B